MAIASLQAAAKVLEPKGITVSGRGTGKFFFHTGGYRRAANVVAALAILMPLLLCLRGLASLA
jgi:hypothetical protein